MIITLLVLLAIASLVARGSLQTYYSSRDARRLASEYQIQLLADSLLLLAQERLVLGDTDTTADTPQEGWALPLTDGKSYRLIIEPSNSRLDLNKSVENLRIQEAAARLLHEAHIGEAALDALMDWIDADATPRRPGLEDGEYLQSRVGYLPKNDRLETVEEALLANGWTIFDRDQLRKYFTVWTAHNLNLNFCDFDVFKAYLPEMVPYWEDISRYRAERGFRTSEDLLAAVPALKNDLNLWKTVLDAVSFKSQFFLVTIEVWSPFLYEKRRGVLARNPLLPKLAPKVVRSDVLDIRPSAS